MTLEERLSRLEIAEVRHEKDIAWMRENLILAREISAWKIANVISLIGVIIALVAIVVTRQ